MYPALFQPLFRPLFKELFHFLNYTVEGSVSPIINFGSKLIIGISYFHTLMNRYQIEEPGLFLTGSMC